MHSLQPEEESIAPVWPLVGEEHATHWLFGFIIVGVDKEPIVNILENKLTSLKEVLLTVPQKLSIVFHQKSYGI